MIYNNKCNNCEEDFLPEKWAEIEKQINLREKQENHSKDKTQRAKKENLIILATISLLIVGITILLIYLTKRKKAKNNN